MNKKKIIIAIVAIVLIYVLLAQIKRKKQVSETVKTSPVNKKVADMVKANAKDDTSANKQTVKPQTEGQKNAEIVNLANNNAMRNKLGNPVFKGDATLGLSKETLSILSKKAPEVLTVFGDEVYKQAIKNGTEIPNDTPQAHFN